MADAFYRTNPRLPDDGIIERSLLGHPRSAHLYATISIELRDVTTGGLLEMRRAAASPPASPVQELVSDGHCDKGIVAVRFIDHTHASQALVDRSPKHWRCSQPKPRSTIAPRRP
jgi:hypothetical protein